MFKEVTIKAKSQAEAIELAARELGLPTDKVKVGLIEETKGILGIGKMNTYLAISEVNLALEGKHYLDNMIQNLGLQCVMEMRVVSDNEIQYRIQANNNAILIGKNGATLLAMQRLVKSYLQNFVDENLVISIDVGDYNKKRITQLERLATITAKEVAKTKVSARLDNLSSFDRRIIHAKLAEWRDVTTISEGVGENRVLIVKPKQ